MSNSCFRRLSFVKEIYKENKCVLDALVLCHSCDRCKLRTSLFLKWYSILKKKSEDAAKHVTSTYLGVIEKSLLCFLQQYSLP